MQIVRENFEQHDKTLTERSQTIKELKAAKRESASQIEHLKTAQGEAVKELEVCRICTVPIRPRFLAESLLVASILCFGGNIDSAARI